MIELLSSMLVAVGSNDSTFVVREETSSDASSDVVSLSEGSVTTPEVASGMESDDVTTSDCTSDLVIISGRSVGCVSMLVGVTRSESVNTEFVLATPSPILAMVVSMDWDRAENTEDSSDTRLDGMSVTEGSIEESEVTWRGISVELKTSVVWTSPMEVIDGKSVVSAELVKNTDSATCVKILVGDTIPVSMGTMLELVSSKSMIELLWSGKFDRIVPEETISEIALGRTSVAEGNVGSSVMICEIVFCVSEPDVIDGTRSVVSGRALVSETSDAIVELSTTIELMVGTSWIVELLPRSSSPVRDSGVMVADASRSEMVFDG